MLEIICYWWNILNVNIDVIRFIHTQATTSSIPVQSDKLVSSYSKQVRIQSCQKSGIY